VEVCTRNGQVVGMGHFHRGSIAVRLLSFGKADLNSIEFWREKLQRAFQVRGIITAPPDAGFRLVHGEGDGLSGLIIDVYGDTAVVQCHSIGMHRQRQLIADALQQVLGKKLRAIYDKSVESLPTKYSENQQNGYLWHELDVPNGFTVIQENGVKFKVDWVSGQKTGFFLDQRENRNLLNLYASGKSVLNAFCYSGGFSCYAVKAGARMVHSVDISGRAMELCAENVALNAPPDYPHKGYTEDVLQFLKKDGSDYEVIVVDPPAFAKSMDKRHNAVQAYKRLNEMAIRRLAPGGILFTFSCSQVVDRELFYNTISAAAMEVGRPARVLRHMTQSPDHPVSLFHPEGSYLKGLVLHVE
jgi:23S rRNA (cytosine1962-C5)-methyltransferase